MKRCLISFAGLLLLGSLAFSADRVPDDNVRTLMRRKLAHSQSILEGIALEDFDMIAKNAGSLAAASQAAHWQVFQTPEYVRQSAEFRRTCDDLAQQAKDKKLDASTLLYVKLTMQCVECHKYVRTVKVARFLPEDSSQWAARD